MIRKYIIRKYIIVLFFSIKEKTAGILNIHRKLIQIFRTCPVSMLLGIALHFDFVCFDLPTFSFNICLFSHPAPPPVLSLPYVYESVCISTVLVFCFVCLCFAVIVKNTHAPVFMRDDVVRLYHMH